MYQPWHGLPWGECLHEMKVETFAVPTLLLEMRVLCTRVNYEGQNKFELVRMGGLVSKVRQGGLVSEVRGCDWLVIVGERRG